MLPRQESLDFSEDDVKGVSLFVVRPLINCGRVTSVDLNDGNDAYINLSRVSRIFLPVKVSHYSKIIHDEETLKV